MIKAEEFAGADKDMAFEEALLYAPERDGILLGIFGTMPDYADARLEQLWQETNLRPLAEVVAYCHRHGIDIVKEDGRPVACYLDIAAMLRAIDVDILNVRLAEGSRPQ
ncbi:hypothetical protein [Telmatospirillum siberiense]|uniref:Uncharacterized protein n=1 Tax=Telmatospirillum siberiense TaxID=382514 RepID=A0A2N3PNJ4_9PROT|nr:hypothetical protein [Telmatospirillum siberiense]PKU21965.1 hypothetical protein CWS72_23975 [Telmatospirillum siberiense]